MTERERKLNPNCVNAGNPFHECGDHCAKRMINGGGKSSVLNGGGIRDEGRNVDLNCPNASNPFHQCADYCAKKSAVAKKHGSGRLTFPVLLKISPKSFSDGSNGGRSVLNGGSAGIEGRNVDPNCVNASNPFHQCAGYCTKKIADGTSKSVQNGGFSKVDVRKIEQGRKVDPRCANASNPFHRCTESCCGSASAATRQPNGQTLGALIARESEEERSSRKSIKEEERISRKTFTARENDEGASCGDNIRAEGAIRGNHYREAATRANIMEEETHKRDIKKGEIIREDRNEAVVMKEHKVDPRCPNASNPFHECADYCFQKISGSGRSMEGKPDRSKRRSHIVTEIRGVDPRCANASNPFHKCAEYCFQKIREAA